MFKQIAASLLLCVLFGCAQNHPATQPVAQRPNQPLIFVDSADENDFGTRTVPGTDIQYDYSEDFFSWHYHAREREATPEEIAVYEIDQHIRDATRLGHDDQVFRLTAAKQALEEEYAPIFKVLAEQDAVRHRQHMRELLAGQNIIPTDQALVRDRN